MAGLARDNARMDLTLLHARSINADDLRGLYAFPDRPTLRMNFVATLDGAANGSDGRSGSINNPADKLVYDLNRELSQVVLVGAQTAHVDLAAMKARLVAEGWTRILSEGGPRFFSALLAEGLVDELALSSVARLISGDHHPRITEGRPSDAHLTRRHLLDIDGTLIGLWDVSY